MVHSTWRAPPIFTPASELATAMPRSLWQCTDQIALSRVGNALAQRLDEVAVELGHGVAHGVRHVDGGRALGDHGLEHPAQEVHVAAVAVLGRELDVARTGCGRSAPTSFACSNTCSGVMRSFFSMCSGEVAMKVWMRARCRALERLGRTRDVAVVGARQRADGRVLDRVGDGLHGLEVAVGAGRRSRPRSRRPSGARAGARCAASRPWSWRRRATARRRARWCRK